MSKQWHIEWITEHHNSQARICDGDGFVFRIAPEALATSVSPQYRTNVARAVWCVNHSDDLVNALLWAEEQFAIMAGLLKEPSSKGRQAALDRAMEGRGHIAAVLGQSKKVAA